MDKKVYEFISAKTNDPIVEWKTCAVSGKPFAIFQSDLEFYDKLSPVFNGVKYSIPAPTLCPEERERRRMAWRNEWKLYRRTCDASGKSIMAMYPDNCGYTVYDRKVWYSDQWDALDYGREYDFTKTFFENFELLNRAVPKKSLHIVDSMENCEYCNYGIFSKSCYLVNGWWRSDHCLYSVIPARSSYDVDGCFNTSCQHTYQCIHCIWCFDCAYSDHSSTCKNSSFLSFCNTCDFCLGCVNLQTAKYCILNKQYSEEEYKIRSKEILKDRESIADFQKNFEALVISSPKKNVNNILSEDCFANYIQNGKNNIFCYVGIEQSDAKYSSYTGMIKEGPVYDGYATTQSGFSLETIGFTGMKSAFVLTGEHGVNECYYCQHVNDCTNCFGCTGIKHKKYCILNKQYSPEEYEILVVKIIEQMKRDQEWWEFFPIVQSTFGYNETIAQTFYPIIREEAIKQWYKRQNLEHFVNIPQWPEKISGESLPSSIQEVDDSIVQKIILCKETGKPFRIIQQELDFYRKHNIPLPTKHQDIRQAELLKKRMPKAFHIAHCDKCKQEMLSMYPENSWYTVWCEVCYNKEIYW